MRKTADLPLLIGHQVAHNMEFEANQKFLRAGLPKAAIDVYCPPANRQFRNEISCGSKRLFDVGRAKMAMTRWSHRPRYKEEFTG